MVKQRINQEWQRLIEQSESSSLSKLEFCKQNGLKPSTFYANASNPHCHCVLIFNKTLIIT
ncbi:hypothetical protein MKT61_008630 [Providencia rettgeri]|nr:hypothetical protein [Providencia rettgeri]